MHLNAFRKFISSFLLLEYNIPGGSLENADSEAPKGRPSRKLAQAITALLDQIRQTEISEQSDDASLQADFIESEPESDSSPSSEEGPIAVAPTRRPVAKKQLMAKKVVDTGDDSDNDLDDGDGEDLISLSCYNLCLTYEF
jgi:hypothetical protein